ncbi:MAG: TonB-dependent receptor [Alphaproteobacteria bacterium]|nr:TonB-dependent receptor [Alphaproteobacteria bacterium]
MSLPPADEPPPIVQPLELPDDGDEAPPVEDPPPSPPAPPTPPLDAPVALDDLDDAEEIVVLAPRPITAASALTADSRDIRLRPITRPGDLVELMPGAFAVQHAGGGKANQYFVRGFDIDHGTDLAISVAGIPANMVSHAHGQGYTDLNFVIPETVARVDVRKGPYEVFDGDLATAGAVDMALAQRVDDSFVSGTYGAFGSFRALALLGVNPGRTELVGAAEIQGADGPFDNPQGFVKTNAYVSATTRVGDHVTLGLGGTMYSGHWSASGQVPLRAVEDGSLSYFGSVDPTEGGQSWRRQLWVTADADFGAQQFTARGWYGGYALNLFSNFTFFAGDPVRGDQIEQEDRRRFGGYDVAYTASVPVGPVVFHTRLGGQGRFDAIDTGLFHDAARERLETTLLDHVDETRQGVYLREDIAFDRWVRLIGGVRYDHFTFGATDATTPGGLDAGVQYAGIVSPKVNVVITPTPWLDLFGNLGRGFHSNDARGVVLAPDPVDPVTASTGYEGGVRLHHARWGQVALVGWGLDLDAETVWVGDEGTTELRGATRRYGFEGSLRATPLPWLLLDLDATVTKSAYVGNAGNGDAVALAPPFTLTAGIGIDHPIGVHGGLRVKHLAARPATEDRSLIAEGWTILDAEVGYRWRFVEATLQVNNVIGSRWKEVQFANESQLPGEPAPVEDLHFTPGWPRTFLGTLTFYPGALLDTLKGRSGRG